VRDLKRPDSEQAARDLVNRYASEQSDFSRKSFTAPCYPPSPSRKYAGSSIRSG
jgi:hypothetical protein